MRRFVQRGIHLKGIKKTGLFPSGNPRCYFRAEDGLIPLPDTPMNSPKFLAAYAEAAKGGPVKVKGYIRHRTGTIGAGIRAFLSSDSFMTRATSTRARWRSFAEEAETFFGPAKLTDLRATHVRRYLAKFDPHPANNRLKLFRALGHWWVDAGLIEIDPARDVRPRETPRTDGHTPWTESDAQVFRDHWPIGTMQRLAFELLFQTGASVVDLVSLGQKNMSEDGWLSYRRAKSMTICTIPVFVDLVPDFYPTSRHLRQCLDVAPRHITWLSTSSGASRSAKATGQWFARAAKSAGIDGKTAHGVRKLLATYMAERGASEAQRMAILGHDTSKQTREYSKSADARRIISGTNFGKSPEQFSKNQENANKINVLKM